MEGRIILAIEAAVAGGSISLIQNGAEIDNWVGRSSTSRAEDLLVDIDALLARHKIAVSDLSLIAVSAGPGSFTGIRIGIATGLGLSTGSGIELASESALKAMAGLYPGNSDLISAVPAGRDTVCFQQFDTTSGNLAEAGEPQTERMSDFLRMPSDKDNSVFLLHSDLFDAAPMPSNTVDFGRNIAFAVGSICDSDPRPVTAPMFISKNF